MSDASPVRAGESLLLGDGRQLVLLDGALDDAGLPGAAYARGEQAGRFTGERLFATNPQLYHAVARLLARGQMTYREIAETCSVSVNTVCGVAYREQIPIETLGERVGRIGLDVARMSLEAIRDLLADPDACRKISAKDLAVIYGIATTNSQLLLGRATARIDTGDVGTPSHSDYFDLIQNVTGLRPGNPPQKGDVVEITPADKASLPPPNSES